ncbi:MAG: AAA family ATPase [Steroidobacter sp.]
MAHMTAKAIVTTGKEASGPLTKPSQQKLLGLDVAQLKNLRDLSLDFDGSALTAIMGGNCSGKTTVLHALACAYGPPFGTDSLGYKFPQFFRPNTDALWQGSRFTMRYSQRVGPNDYPDLKQLYEKASDRWSPRYESRPEPYTRFVNIGESVPDLDILNLSTMMHYTKSERNDEVGKLVRDSAGQILNRVYDNFYDIKYIYRGKQSIGVKSNSITYSGLSMSSGEQRVFRILNAIYRAPNYALLLIDEIDLFLHQDALEKLLSKLQEHCDLKNKQLVFTTHFPPVAAMYDKISIYTLNRTPSKTIVWAGYSYEAMRHITGNSEKPISIYVEDDVAEQIVSCVASNIGIRKFLTIAHYGPVANAFSLGAGLLLSGVNMEHSIALMDGDALSRKAERIESVKRVLTGTGANHDAQRKRLMGFFRALRATRDPNKALLSPEQMLHRMLQNVAATDVMAERRELYDIALGINNVPEKHQFVNRIIQQTGERRDVALSKIVELASKSKNWEMYTRPIRIWLLRQKKELSL